MKSFSVKERVIFLYTVIMVAAIALVVEMFYFVSARTVLDNAKDTLVATVDEKMDDINIVDGHLVIADSIDYETANGVTIAVYNENGLEISGLMPDDFDVTIKFLPDTARKVEGKGDDDYYVYDRLIENETTGKIWLRGVIYASVMKNAPEIANVFRIALFFIPILLLIAVVGGTLLTNRAFKPLKLIADTASNISNGNDLSQRIGVGDPDSQDEVLRAAGVFDTMLDRLEESFDNEKQFTNNASHELRTPNAIIMSRSEYALESLDDREEVESSLEIIHAQSEKMDHIVSELLALARADRGIDFLNKKHTDIGLLAEESAASFYKMAEENNIKLMVDADMEVYMDADPVFFGRLYENLISNAIKYGKDGGRVDLSVKKRVDGIEIIVSDDGIGISDEDLPHVFERFYRATDQSKEKSVGLGLPLVKWIVDSHGGEISIESKLKEGTVIRIKFPA